MTIWIYFAQDYFFIFCSGVIDMEEDDDEDADLPPTPKRMKCMSCEFFDF